MDDERFTKLIALIGSAFILVAAFALVGPFVIVFVALYFFSVALSKLN
jgi:hypothetical protein